MFVSRATFLASFRICRTLLLKTVFLLALVKGLDVPVEEFKIQLASSTPKINLSLDIINMNRFGRGSVTFPSIMQVDCPVSKRTITND